MGASAHERWLGPAALAAAAAFGAVIGGAGEGASAPWTMAVLLALTGSLAIVAIHRLRRRFRLDADEARLLQEQLSACRSLEQTLHRRETFYHTILEDIPEMICRWYPDGRVSYVNEAYCRYFDVSREELERQGGFALFHPGGDSATGPVDTALYSAQPVVVMEFPVSRADGTVRWQRWVDRALFDEKGDIREFQSIGEDITERKQAEAETARLLDENRRLARMGLAIQEEERARLARELHDELGQSLTAIRAEAECILQINRDRSPFISECAGAINKVAGQVYSVVHEMMHRLRPALLDDLGLVEALNELLRQWRSHHPEVSVTSTLEPLPPLPGPVELAAYRIAQEALTNVAKHAQASRLELVLRRVDGTVELRVRDDGGGIEERTNGGGYGLLGMRERALAVDGEFQVITGPGTGTTVVATLPLASGEAGA